MKQDISRRDLIKLGFTGVAGVCVASLAIPQIAHAESSISDVIFLNEDNCESIKKNNEFVRAKWAEAVAKAEEIESPIVVQTNEPKPMPLAYSQIRDVYDFTLFNSYGVLEFPIEFWCTYDRQNVGTFWTFQEVYGVGASSTTTMFPVDVLYCSYALINAHDSTLAAQYNLRLRGTTPIGSYLDIQQAFYVEFYAFSEALKVWTP